MSITEFSLPRGTVAITGWDDKKTKKQKTKWEETIVAAEIENVEEEEKIIMGRRNVDDSIHVLIASYVHI